MNRAVLFILGTLFLFASSGAAQTQTRTIVGRVVDARTGRPVSSGQVSVKGTKLRDRLRPDGVFVIRPQVSNRNVVLVIRGDGYSRHEIAVAGDKGAVFIRLTADRVELEPLAFTAGAATGTVEGERLQGPGAPATSVLQALQGKVAGMDIQGNSGVPAGDLQLRLRGVNTILGPVSPLFVVDGVVLSTAAVGGGVGAVTGGFDAGVNRILDLNPADIESIEILKGARASMYGSRGANGVVLIRTKRGPSNHRR
jgi:TonB-dependent SusC/RagA subfamily outer membrane receptor